MEDVRKLAREN